jgi:hypothetical protein
MVKHYDLKIPFLEFMPLVARRQIFILKENYTRPYSYMQLQLHIYECYQPYLWLSRSPRD